jgi:hypothetical protein
MDLADFSHLMTGLAVLAGGAWALFNFTALNKLTQSRAELANLELDRVNKQKEIESKIYENQKMELEIQALEQKARVGSVINVTVQASQLALPNDPSLYVSAIVQVENKGTISTRLAYEQGKKPLSVYEVVSFGDVGTPQFGSPQKYGTPVATSPGELSPSVNVRAGGFERLHFLFRVKSPGLYLLTFAVSLDQENQDIAKKLGFEFKGNWVAKEYLVVR